MTVRNFEGVSDQRKAAHKRRLDAWALLRAGRVHAHCAMYIGGYAIECKLKSVAMETFGCRTLSQLARKLDLDDASVYSHGLEALAILLPLYSTLKRSSAWRDFAGEVNRWRPSWRYDPNDIELSKATTFLEAVDRLYHWLDSNQC